MAAFEYRQAEEIRKAFERTGSATCFSDANANVELFPEKTAESCTALAAALVDLEFALTPEEEQQVRRGKDFIQLKNGLTWT
jgi:hypothetical protein